MNAELIKTNSAIAAETTDALRDRLSSLLARTAQDLSEMAAIVAELESRGEDLSALRLGIIDHLRRIAAGQLLPEIVVRFSGFPSLLNVAAHLPIEDQRRLSNGEPIDMAVWRGEQIEWRKVDPLYLTRDQLTLVFASDRLRPQAEQVSVLESRRERQSLKPAKPKLGRVRPDRERGGIIVGKSFVPLVEVLDALGALPERTGDPNAPAERPVGGIKLTDAEHEQLRLISARNDTPITELVYRAMRAAGLI